MTKKELEKAIKNGESVWGIYKKTNRICEIKSSEINKIHSYTITWGKEYYCYIKDLFKSKAEAEHYLNHANVTRTETLPFLTWEEFLEGKEIKFNSKKSEYLMIYLAGNITIYKCYYDDNGFKLELRIFDEEATEANFYKAYDECVKLFKGEE